MKSFKTWGRVGGLKRARRLSTSERKAIAAKAANVRWKNLSSHTLMVSVRLDKARLEDPVFLEELLSEGSLDQWGKLYQEIEDQPFGPAAQALERVLSSTTIYGITPLWKNILTSARGS